MTATTSLIFLALISFPVAAAAWNDLRAMRIPNLISIALVGIFIVFAPFLLTWEEILTRVLVTAVVFAIGFGLNMAGLIGGGDVKFGSATLLFVASADWSFYLRILGGMAIGGVAAHRIFLRIPAARAMAPHWTSWTERRMFPFGFSIAGAIVFYLIRVAFDG